METISAVSIFIGIVSALGGAAVTGVGFATYLRKRDDRLRRAEKIAMWALQRTGSLYDKLGMKERFVDDLQRLILAMETPTSTEAIRND
jgi:hypothetical protein